MTTKETLAGRYDAPLLPDVPVPRTELYAVLDDAALRCGVVCLQAPAGYGKTVTAALWLRGHGFLHAWVGLDPYDDTPLLFYRRICTALAHLWPESDAPARTLSAAGFAAAPVEHVMDAVLSLPQAHETREKRRVLVLDDLHLLRNPEILGSLAFVLRRLPEGVTTLLLTRGSAATEVFRNAFARAGKLESEEAIGQEAIVIGPELLRFSRDEAAFCLSACGHDPAPGEMEDLYARTGGWPIAVAAYTAGPIGCGRLSLRSGKRGSPGADMDILARCIERQIWGPLDAAAKDFLLRTCVAETLTPGLCARLTGTTEKAASAIMGRIASHSLLTAASGGGYVHHHLFRDFLRARLDEAVSRGEIDREALYSAAAEHYLSARELYAAIHFALLSGRSGSSLPNLREIFRYDARNNAISHHVNEIRAHLAGKVPPPMFAAYPHLYLVIAWYHHLVGDAPALFSLLDELQTALPEILERHPEFREKLIFISLLDHRLTWDNTLDAAHVEPPPADRRPTFPTQSKNLPFFHRGTHDFASCPGLPEDTTRFRAIISPLSGDTYKTAETAVLAGLWFEKNRLDRALDLAERGETVLTPSAAPETIFFARMITIAILDAMERTAEAHAKRTEIRAALEAADGRFLFPNLDAYETKLRLQDGDARAARAWLDNYFVVAALAPEAGGKPRRLELFRVFQHLTTARALMIAEAPETARTFLERLVRLAADFNRITDRAEALALLAILEWHRGDRKRAASLLEEALCVTQPHGFVRVFSDEGAAILPILKRISSRIAQPGYDGKINLIYANEIRMAAFARSKTHRGINSAMNRKPIKLSKRQKLVLEHLAMGLGRKDISAQTGLSEENIKAHTTALYRALDVSSAMDAVLKARGLGLIT